MTLIVQLIKHFIPCVSIIQISSIEAVIVMRSEYQYLQTSKLIDIQKIAEN